MIRTPACPPGASALLADRRGSALVQTIVLVSALALASVAAVKGLSGRIGSSLDCTGDKIVGLGGGAAPCSDSAGPGGAPPVFASATTDAPPGGATAEPTPLPTTEAGAAEGGGGASSTPVPEPVPEPVPTPVPSATPTATPTPTPGSAEDPFPVPAPEPDPEPAPPPDDGGGGNPIGDFFGGFFGGDFVDCTSGACVGGQIISGFIPVVGDGRDTIAAGAKCVSGENCTDLIWAGVGWVPVLGDIAKGGRKVKKVAEGAAEVADTVGDVGRRLPPPTGPLADAARKGGDVKVIGRRTDTEVAEDWDGHDVLNDPNWTLARNDEWINDGVRSQQNFYMASPRDGNMVQTSGPYAGQPTIYARELAQLEAAGYVRIGDYMVHPSNVADFRP